MGRSIRFVNGAFVHANWQLTTNDKCSLPDQRFVTRERLFRVGDAAVLELTSAADSGYADDRHGARSRDMLFEWALPIVTAAIADNQLWVLSRDVRGKPEAAAHEILRADSAEGRSAVLPVPVSHGARPVELLPTASGIYAVDGTNIHVLKSVAVRPAAESDAETIRLRAEWRLDEIAKTLPDPVSGLSYDEAYAKLGVPENERAAFFEQTAKAKR